MSKQKTVILFIIFSFCFSMSKVKGQAALLVLIFGDKAASEKFNFSIVSGLNVSNLSGFGKTDALIGLNFGLGINMKLSDKFYLKPEFRPLSPKGFQRTNSLNTGNPGFDGQFKNVNNKVLLNYIDVPILLAYQAAPKWQIAFGPQFSFLTKAKDHYYGDGQDYERDIKTSLTKTDFGLTTAITYMMSNKRNGKGINLQLRYYAGLSDVYKNMGANKNNVFSFNIEFPFISDDIAAKRLKDSK